MNEKIHQGTRRATIGPGETVAPSPFFGPKREKEIRAMASRGFVDGEWIHASELSALRDTLAEVDQLRGDIRRRDDLVAAQARLIEGSKRELGYVERIVQSFAAHGPEGETAAGYACGWREAAEELRRLIDVPKDDRFRLIRNVPDAVAFLRSRFPNDGAEGESVHRACDALDLLLGLGPKAEPA